MAAAQQRSELSAEVGWCDPVVETRAEVRRLRHRSDALERRARDYERNEEHRAECRQWHIIYAVNWSVAVLSFVIVVIALRGGR